MSKSKHDACIGTQAGVICRKFAFIHCREGFRLFESALRKKMFRHNCKRVLIAMEPSGIYWYALFERLKGCGYGVCLVNCKVVRNNRKTMHDGISKTDEKDAHSIFDLLQQGKFFLPEKVKRGLKRGQSYFFDKSCATRCRFLTETHCLSESYPVQEFKRNSTKRGP